MRNDDQTTTIQHMRQCQWCSGGIPPEATRCPRCGSSTVNDDLRIVDVMPTIDDQATSLSLSSETGGLSATLEEPSWSPPAANRSNEDRMLIIVLLLGISSVVGVLLGLLIGPPLLQQALESLLQTPIEDTSGFRQTGGIIGGVLGLFFGSIIGTIYR